MTGGFSFGSFGMNLKFSHLIPQLGSHFWLFQGRSFKIETEVSGANQRKEME